MLYSRAVTQFRERQESNGEKPGLRKICLMIQAEHLRETGRTVILSHSTLGRLVKGGQMIADFNRDKSVLLKQEAKELIAFTIEVAAWGFPLDKRRLAEHADELI
ncbi:hypothetical protein PM082_022218 [Marasmius tenuissimus]|nr:hypothetical protein PM082_022218 [Marasmius tenuissimus]